MAWRGRCDRGVAMRTPNLVHALFVVPLLHGACAVETESGEPEDVPVEELAPDEPVLETARILTDDGERDVAIQRVDGRILIDGDIEVSEHELEAARVDRNARGGITALSTRRWPGGVVPFVIDPSLPNPQRVNDAIAHWQLVTPVRFVARTNQTDFVRFAPGTGCSSPVGRQGGAQTITLDTGCGRGATIHEIGHAVGSWHEQSRTDRDAYVTVHSECIQDGKAYNFSKFSDGANVGPYDYRSIMHYSRFAFSNGCETLTPSYPNTNIGQQAGLSAGDVLTVHRILYGSRPGVDVVHADYDGDGKIDIATKDDTGAWRVDYSNNGYGVFDLNALQYGFANANPVPADYDGDGKADLAIKGDDGAWFIDYSGDTYDGWDLMLYGYGGTDVVTVPADYDGDGKDDIAIKSNAGYWYIDYAANGFGSWNVIVGGYGGADAVPVPADYDGDGKADLSVKNGAGYWHIDYANGGFGAWNLVVGGYGARSTRSRIS
jgi:hypothetical protein